MVVVFRVDASHTIGTGHVMRCLTLAEELRRCGADCIFVCRGFQGSLIPLIKEMGFMVFRLSMSVSSDIIKDDNKTSHSK